MSGFLSICPVRRFWERVEAVTNKVNVLRGVGITALNAIKTHCMHGHEFTPGNTKYYDRAKPNSRRCAICGKRIAKAFRDRKRAHHAVN